MTHRNGSATIAPISSADLSAALLAAEKRGQFPAEAWPAMRDLLLSSSDPALATTGFAALGRAGDDPAATAEAAANLAALADDLAARAQQLGELINL